MIEPNDMYRKTLKTLCVDESFLLVRADWLQVFTVDTEDGRGWDVAVKIDGTYGGEDVVTKDEMVAYFTDWIREEVRKLQRLGRERPSTARSSVTHLDPGCEPCG